MGRWSWCSDFWDFDHDGYPDLYVANGYISAPNRSDLASFFWRQVVGRSPDDATPTPGYERGWQALNELIRSDNSWNGYERNVMFANNRDGTFSEVSGAVKLDFAEDGRSFALADIDHDGRLEVILKNRNAPQLRILHNAMPRSATPSPSACRERKAIVTPSEPPSPFNPEPCARPNMYRPAPDFSLNIPNKSSSASANKPGRCKPPSGGPAGSPRS